MRTRLRSPTLVMEDDAVVIPSRGSGSVFLAITEDAGPSVCVLSIDATEKAAQTLYAALGLVLGKDAQ